MAQANVKLETFGSTDPQPTWLNQLQVTTSMGKQYEQKGEMEKAAKCYETVLYYDPKNVGTRIRLSKCYRKLLQLENALKHQRYAMQIDPKAFRTIENQAELDFELNEYETSLITYNNYSKKYKTSYDCNQGLLKVNQAIEHTLSVSGIMDCLGGTILKMLDDPHILNEPNQCKTCDRSIVWNKLHRASHKRMQEAYYLRNITGNLEFYRKLSKELPKSNVNDKLIVRHIREIIQTFETAKNDLYRQKPFYFVSCQRPAAVNRRLDDRKKVKDNMIKLQTAKYVETIVKHCLAGELESARQQAELALKYMDHHWYRPLNVVNALYEVFGLAIYLINRDVPEWSDELNKNRIMFLFGSSNAADRNGAYEKVYRESYFGPQENSNRRSTLKKLNKQLKETEFGTYSLYLQYERIKCHLKLGEIKEMRRLSKQMFSDAFTLGSIAWQVNALMTIVIAESRLSNTVKCMETLEIIISLSKTLGNEDVTAFFRKTWKLFADNKIRGRMMSPEEKRISDIIDIMPDTESALLTRNLLFRINRLSVECRMPFLLGETPEIDCATIARHNVRCEPLTISKNLAKRLEN
ncbi:Tetratricopeptide repeat,Tetratricopeptide repeat-containing domain,Tetratricopeptide-like helical [Cinara cedri]|uniref:Outer dynein arm-docking complex subunit 4 n=1 Tax=Cinara cedri TaxID=506608 RepID=A0A5E4MC36_9HEMI|nr:Tetratricopeptide repeat,Tetratricopeptide repeat-containing domain,Tetratricopeptide-like helical [Cinara cedri]